MDLGSLELYFRIRLSQCPAKIPDSELDYMERTGYNFVLLLLVTIEEAFFISIYLFLKQLNRRIN